MKKWYHVSLFFLHIFCIILSFGLEIAKLQSSMEILMTTMCAGLSIEFIGILTFLRFAAEHYSISYNFCNSLVAVLAICSYRLHSKLCGGEFFKGKA